MNNASALGGCGGDGLLMRFLGQIVLTEPSRNQRRVKKGGVRVKLWGRR